MITEKTVRARINQIKAKIKVLIEYLKILFFYLKKLYTFLVKCKDYVKEHYLSAKKAVEANVIVEYNRFLMFVIDTIISLMLIRKRTYEVRAVYAERGVSKQDSINMLEKLHAFKMVEWYQESLLNIKMMKPGRSYAGRSSGATTISFEPVDQKPFISFESYVLIFVKTIQRAVNLYLTEKSRLIMTMRTISAKTTPENVIEHIEIQKTYWIEEEVLLSIHNIHFDYILELAERGYNTNTILFEVDLFLFEEDDRMAKELFTPLRAKIKEIADLEAISELNNRIDFQRQEPIQQEPTKKN